MKREQQGTKGKEEHRQKSRQGNGYGQKPIINTLPLPSDHYSHLQIDLRHRGGLFRLPEDEKEVVSDNLS